MISTLKKTLDPEAVAIQALAHIAADAERLARFLAMTGIEPETLREAAREPGFLSQVLEFVCSDDSGLLAFAANAGLAPDAVARARLALAGPVAN
ncbi:MAG TPA: DUF3572 domain-containing protein [Beijerinckiaceae bacterium]|nr:DUF3572 domain-containing protein [Beijerinckiaceae bacterium]